MNNNKQQTAVHWLAQEIINQLGIRIENTETGFKLLSQAKELEKQQIMDAHLTGLIHPLEIEATKQAEQYYNETFNQ
jgi:hypothetical protein